MNVRKLLIYILSFLSFIGIGLMISNIQSLQADQILNASGLSSNSRSLVTNRNIEIRTLIKYLEKYQSSNELELQLTNRYSTDEVLVWSNSSMSSLPVAKGRYFTPSDFQGQVTLAVSSPNPGIQTLITQNNKYLILNNHYISVIGTLKENVSQTQNTYYLTTGVDQANSAMRLNNFYIMIDSPNRDAIAHVARYLKAKVVVPNFVKKHQQTHSKLSLAELLVAIILGIFALILSVAIAFVHFRNNRLDRVDGNLWVNLIVNRSLRFFLLEASLATIGFFIVRWRAFFTDQSIYAYALGILLILQLIVYYGTIIYFRRRFSRV